MYSKFFLVLIPVVIACSCVNKPKTISRPEQENPEKIIRTYLSALAGLKKTEPDTLEVLQVGKSNLYLCEFFYTDDVSFPIYLLKAEGKQARILDSLLVFCEIDLHSPQKLKYNQSMDAYEFESVSSGSGDYEVSTEFFRVKNNELVELFSFSLSKSMFYVEENPSTWESIDTKLSEQTKNKIVLESTHELGDVVGDETITKFKQSDRTEFEFSEGCTCFVWKKSSNPKFKEYWLGNRDFPDQ